MTDPFAAPAERMPIFDGPAPPRTSYEAAVWQRIAQCHPHKFARALRQVQWLERMYNFYYGHP